MSLFTNFGIQTNQNLRDYVLTSLGAPLITIELTNSQLDLAIDEAIETFTKYCYTDEVHMAIPLSGYTTSGLLIPSNITAIYTIADDSAGLGRDSSQLFTTSNFLWNQGALPAQQMMQGNGFDGSLVMYEMALQNIDMLKLMLGGRGWHYNFNVRTHYLTLYPDPIKEGLDAYENYVVCSCTRIGDESFYFGEQWVKQYALALSMIIMGRVRKKYQSTRHLGGGTVDSSCLEEGIALRDKLFEDLRARESGLMGFFVG